jgi:Fur family ferric uptake transcriptional regulator
MNELGERLRAHGMRLTSQRQRVLDAVAGLGHASPEEIVEVVAADGCAAMSASTVYRSLDALQELGLVSHTHVDHRVPSYHLTSHATHVHLVCRRCGWVGEVPVEVAAGFVGALAERTGFAAEVSHAAIHGLCARCAAALAEDADEEDGRDGAAAESHATGHPHNHAVDHPHHHGPETPA